jgi:4-diphosphocytidyl-2-C-methyl-D-erythritol kinase
VKKIEILSPAKINLILRVFRRKKNGYHYIQSIMQTISLFDEITIKKEGNGIDIKCTEKILNNQENIVYKSAKLFFEKTGIKNCAKIYIKKTIPLCSGLGGGSSNAASTLIGLNILWNYPLSKKEIFNIATNIGSDVPFFLYGGTCLVEGIGDKITQLPYIGNYYVILLIPKIKISSKIAYELYDKNKISPLTKGKYFIKMCMKKFDTKYMHNDFENVILNKYPIVKKLKEEFEKYTTQVHLSGKGPTLFTMKTHEKEARILCNKLSKYAQVFLTKTTKRRESIWK